MHCDWVGFSSRVWLNLEQSTNVNQNSRVCNAQGDPIPGPRPFPLFTSVKFPWSENVGYVEEVGSVVSYHLSSQLSREGLICGPSSGMALQGLFNRLGKAKAAGSLGNYRDENGLISCVFLCCDLPYQYMDGYFDRLDAEEIHPIMDSVSYGPVFVERHCTSSLTIIRIYLA
jgi:hypothetical protein